MNDDSNPADSAQDENPVVSNETNPGETGTVVTPTGAPGTTTVPTNETTDNIDPLARPMEKVEPPEVAKPKKKTGLIVGLIVGLVVLIGGGIALALVMLNFNKTDAVSMAFSKIMEGKTPTNTMIDGSINVALKDTTVPFENVKVDLKSEGIVTSLINTTSAVITATLRDGEDIKLNLDEIYATSGDLYLKVEGIEDALKELKTVNNILNPLQTEKLETEVLETTGEVEKSEELTQEVEVEKTTSTEVIIGMLSLIAPIDGQWLKLSVDELNSVAQNTTSQNNLNCLTDLVGNLGNNTNTLAETYRRNPFVYSTKEKLGVASKQDPIYKVLFNEEYLKGFAKSVADSAVAEQLTNCLGYKDAEIDTDVVMDDLKNLPDFYVEVDKDSNFTRLYFVVDIEDNDAEVTTDLSLSYPTNVNIAEPLEYKNFSEVIGEIVKSLYVTGN